MEQAVPGRKRVGVLVVWVWVWVWVWVGEGEEKVGRGGRRAVRCGGMVVEEGGGREGREGEG